MKETPRRRITGNVVFKEKTHGSAGKKIGGGVGWSVTPPPPTSKYSRLL
jgi:hypothetical protein